MSSAPIHYEGGRLDVAATAALVAVVRASAPRACSAALDDLAAALPAPIVSISLRLWPPDFPDDIAVQRRAPYEARPTRSCTAWCSPSSPTHAAGRSTSTTPSTSRRRRPTCSASGAEEVLRGPRARSGRRGRRITGRHSPRRCSPATGERPTEDAPAASGDGADATGRAACSRLYTGRGPAWDVGRFGRCRGPRQPSPPRHPVGTLLSVNVGMPKDVPWQGKTVFTGVFKDPVTGPRRVRKLNVDGDGQGDLGRARRRAARRVRLPDRLLPLLGARARARRLRLRAVRRELHGRGAERRRGLHRRPLPDRHRRLRGHAAARHLLPRRDPHERPAHPRAARLPPPPRLLLPRARGGRGRRRETRSSSSPPARSR